MAEFKSAICYAHIRLRISDLTNADAHIRLRISDLTNADANNGFVSHSDLNLHFEGGVVPEAQYARLRLRRPLAVHLVASLLVDLGNVRLLFGVNLQSASSLPRNSH